MGCCALFECRDISQFTFKVLNFLLTLSGLAIIGYGIYLFIEYEKSLSANVILNEGIGPFLASVTLSSSVWSELSSAWCICVFIGAGVLLFLLSCFGLIGATTGNRFFLSCYGKFVVLLIVFEVGCATVILFDSNWKDLFPTDNTGYFEDTCTFLTDHWTSAKFVGFLIVVLEVVLFLLSLILIDIERILTPPTAPPVAGALLVQHPSIQV